MSTACTSVAPQHVPAPVASVLKNEKIQMCHEVYRPNENWQLQRAAARYAVHKTGPLRTRSCQNVKQSIWGNGKNCVQVGD